MDPETPGNNPTAPHNPIDRLEAGLRGVLQASFDEEIRGLVQNYSWYSSDLPINEAFRLWVYEHINGANDWIFQPIRASERKYLCDCLGLEKAVIIGKTPNQLSDLILEAIGMPSPRVAGVESTLVGWRDITILIENEEDEKAAVLCRERAERLLRKILHFYCSAGYGQLFISILENPGSLRLPNNLANVVTSPDEEKLEKLSQQLLAEGGVDLGFLNLAIAKYSARIKEARRLHPSGQELLLYSNDDQSAFENLALALQPYAHDKTLAQGCTKADPA